MNPKILLVDEEDSYRQLLKIALEGAGYRVVTAPNGKIAKSLVAIYEDFAACITEIHMPEVDGLDLLYFIMQTRPMPVILLSGDSELQDPEEPTALGAARLLKKPFKKEVLLAALEECLKTGVANLKPVQSENETVDKDEDYSRIYLQDFISGRELQYDIYIRLTAQKYLKVAHQGSSFSFEELNIYKARNIEYLYMKKEDFKKYIGFNVSLSGMVTSSVSLPKAKKIQFIKHTTEIISAQLHLEGVDEASFDNAKSVMGSALSVMSDSDEMVSMLTMLNSASDTTYSHSIGVSFYATMLAKAVGMNSPLELFKVSMGGMLHDIGKKELPPEIINRPRHLLTAEEIKIYETHTIRGAQILSKLPFVQGDIIKIVSQHHENCLGLGYPANLRKDYIHPLARLVSVANEFCNLAVRGPDSPPLLPSEAIERMSSIYLDTLDPVFFVALAKIFNFQLDPSYHDAQRRNIRSSTSTQAD
ncbi:MAG: HD domain-containing phosphohydrolase [Bdellovibrionia bacterium]